MMTTQTETVDLLIGFRRDGTPIYLHTGAEITVSDDDASDDDDEILDDDEDESDDREDDAESDDEDDIKDDWKPPSRRDYEQIMAAQRRNNEENKRYRLLKKELTRRGVNPDTSDGQEKLADLLNTLTFGDGKKPGDAEVARTVARETAKLEQRYKPALAKVATDAALSDHGFSGTASERKRLMDMLDLDEVDVGDDGSVTGIAEQIETIKADIPSWFKPKREVPVRRSGAADVDGGNRRGKPAEGPKGWAAKAAAQLD